jgi:hypothetical protein
VTVDWKETPVLDALNEIGLKSGLKFDFDQAFASWAGERKVTFDGYSVPVREALRVCSKAAGFEVAPDPATGRYKITADPAHPTRLALSEKKVSVAWNGANVLKAAKDLEKKAGVKIDFHPCLRDRLKNRKVSWEANEVTLREALETLWVFPPPSIPARIDPKEKMVLHVVYTGPPETKADVEFALDDRRVTLNFSDATLPELAKFLTDVVKVPCVVDPRAVKDEVPRVTNLIGAEIPLRQALDRAAKAANVGWKVVGPKVVFLPASAK